MNTYRKKIIYILVFISLLSLVFLFFVTIYKKPVVNTNTINKDISQVKVGLTKLEIEKEIGKEVSSTQSGNLTINKYKSDNIYRPNQIYFNGENSELIIKEITDSSMTTDLMRKESGLATNILYELKEHSTFNLYVYPNKGIAYKGHANGGLVLEIWYFEPTNIESFIQKYARNYQTTPYKSSSY